MGNKNEALLSRVHYLEARGRDLVRPLGVAPLVSQPVLFQTPRDDRHDWIVLPLADDPAFQAGELDIPRPQKQTLSKLRASGIYFDTFLIAHEIAKGHGLPLTPSIAASKAALEEQQLRPFAEVSDAIGKVSRAAKVLGTAAALIPLAPLGFLLLADPDPVLIGVLTEDGTATDGGLSAFFEVIRW